MYFKSEVDRIIYALLRLDGEQRLRELGVNKSHTRDLEKAKSWRNKLAKLIHPDVCKHPESVEASTELTNLYEQMTKTMKISYWIYVMKTTGTLNGSRYFVNRYSL